MSKSVTNICKVAFCLRQNILKKEKRNSFIKFFYIFSKNFAFSLEIIKLYGLNLKYHMNLVKSYVSIGITKTKIQEFEQSKDVYDRIKLGLLYIETGEYRKGVNILDEICYDEPDLLITPALRQYIKQIIDEKL